MKPASYGSGYGQPSAATSQQHMHSHSLPPWQQSVSTAQQPSHGHHRHHSASSSSGQRQHSTSAFGSASNGAQASSSAQQGEFSATFGGQGASQGYGYSNSPYAAEQNRLEVLAREQQAAAQQQLAAQQHAAAHQQQQVADRATLQHEQLRAQIRDQPPRVPLADRDIYMLSLPSQDQPDYYDSAASDDELDGSSHTGATTSWATTNRGNKLSASAPYIRQGRLGAYPHTDAGFPATVASASKRRKLLSGAADDASGRGGFALTPNLHLIPRDAPSLPAPAVLPPAPQSPLDLLLSSTMQWTFGPKNRTFQTLGMSATGLIEQEGPLIGSLSRVCAGLRGEGFEFRWVGDEEVRKEREKERALEEEEERQKREKRRKEEEERRREKRERETKEREERLERERIEEEERRKKEAIEEREERERQQAKEKQERIEREQREKEEAIKREAEEKALRDKEEADAKAQAIKVEEEAALAAAAALKDDQPTASVTAEGAQNPDSTAPGINPAGASAAVATTGATVEGTTPAPEPAAIAANGALPPLPSDGSARISASTSTAMDVDAAASSNAAPASAPNPLLALGDLPPLPNATPSTAGGDNDEDTKMTDAGTEAEDQDRSGADEAAADDLMHGGEEEEEDDDDTTTTRRRSGRRTTRSSRAKAGDGGSTSDSGGEEGEDSDERAIRRIERAEELAAAEAAEADSAAGSETPPRVVEEELPEYAKRLVDPEVYVRSLFVSEGAVELPSREALQAQATGMALPAGVAATESLSPNEQEVLLHDCLTDLHRFLADSLEYRSRLAEIRDGVLGVERRRKGMWKVVRCVGQDWMDEESQAAES